MFRDSANVRVAEEGDRGSTGARTRAFTLVETMVAAVVLLILLGIVFRITSQTSNLWTSTNQKITAFQNARAAFEAVTRNLSQATLNSYYDYYDASWNRRDTSSSDFAPAKYGRYSELAYVSGPSAAVLGTAVPDTSTHALFFQAPLGRVDDAALRAESSATVNALGYYVQYGSRAQYDRIPKFLQGESGVDRKRLNLIEWVQPSEKLKIYDKDLLAADPRGWFLHSVADGSDSRVLSENIVALIVSPKLDEDDETLAPNYLYDTNPASDSDPSDYDELRSHLLPPLARVTLVAIDGVSALRLEETYGDTLPPLVPDGAFQNAASFDSDLANLESVLNGDSGGPKLNYRIFNTMVNLRGGQ